MEITAAPVPALVGLVDSCVGYDIATAPDASHHGLPSPSITVILSFGDPLDCAWDDDGGRGRWRGLASGLHLRPARVRAHGRMSGIQLAFTPAGARRLLGVPAGSLAGVLADPADLPLGRVDALLDALAALPWPDRLTSLQAHLAGAARRLEARSGPEPEVAEAWRLIRTRSGRVGVAALADHLGWSRRRLARRFTAEYGVSPKQAGELSRFDRARALAEAGVPLADAAARAGFSDQPHLTRAWRALAGQTPTQTLRETQTFKTASPDRGRITP